MRARPEEHHFANFLLDVGDGTANDEHGYITLPSQCRVLPLDDLVGAVDKELFSEPISRRDWKTVAERVILAPLNTQVDEWNEKVLAMLPVDNPDTDEAIYYSIDEALKDGENDRIDMYPLEFLHTLKPSGFFVKYLFYYMFKDFHHTNYIYDCMQLSNSHAISPMKEVYQTEQECKS